MMFKKVSFLAIILLSFFFSVFSLVLLQDYLLQERILGVAETQFQYGIISGVKDIDIVNSSDGLPVASPSVKFGTQAFSNSPQDALGVLGTLEQTVRAYNPTDDTEFTVSIAPVGNFTDAQWSDGVSSYPIQSVDADDGRLTIDPSASVISSDVGCSIDPVDINVGSQAYFLDHPTQVNVESIDLMIANGDVSHCRYDLRDVQIQQRVPASQNVGNYVLGMILTIN